MTARTRNNPGPSFKKEGENSVGAENTRPAKELSVNKFMEIKPPVFFGTETAEEAKDWLSRIDCLFDSFQCSDNCKLRLAVNQLKGDGYKWWLGTKIGLESQYGAVSWDKLKSAFLGFYFPNAIQHAKFRKLLNLRQENLTVHEYAKKFSSLLCYAPSFVTSEMAKIHYFQQGLRPEIYEGVVVNHADSWMELRNMAMTIEYKLMAVNQSQSSVQSGGTNSTPSVAQKSHFKKLRLPMSSRTIQKASSGQSTLSRTCYACGQQMGLIARNCP